MRLTWHMWLIMVTCVVMYYVEGNGTRLNICGANADETLKSIKYAPAFLVPKLIEELRTDSEPIMEVITFLARILIVLTI